MKHKGFSTSLQGKNGVYRGEEKKKTIIVEKGEGSKVRSIIDGRRGGDGGADGRTGGAGGTREPARVILMEKEVMELSAMPLMWSGCYSALRRNAASCFFICIP